MALAIALSLSATAVTFKKYEVRSGKVSYTIRGSGNVMGATQEVAGKKRLIFDQYGFRELEEEATVEKFNIMGQTQKKQSHTLTYRNGTKVEIADFQRKSISETEAPGMELMIAAANQNLAQMGKDFLKQMGGKKVGTDTVAGYRCDVWKLPAVTQCIYKGVPLRIDSEMMGIHRVETATRAEFDVPVSDADYKIPDFPRRNVSAVPAGGGTAPTPQEIKAMMRSMGASGAAADPVAILKQEMLAQEPALRFVKSCLEKSRKLSEANECEKMFSHRVGEPSQPFDRWDEATKRATLKEIDKAIDSSECVLKATTLQEMQKCEPEE